MWGRRRSCGCRLHSSHFAKCNAGQFLPCCVSQPSQIKEAQRPVDKRPRNQCQCASDLQDRFWYLAPLTRKRKCGSKKVQPGNSKPTHLQWLQVTKSQYLVNLVDGIGKT